MTIPCSDEIKASETVLEMYSSKLLLWSLTCSCWAANKQFERLRNTSVHSKSV